MAVRPLRAAWVASNGCSEGTLAHRSAWHYGTTVTTRRRRHHTMWLASPTVNMVAAELPSRVQNSRNLQQPNVEMESPGAPPPRLIAAGKGNVPLINLRHYFSNQYSPSLDNLFVLAFSLPWLSLT